MSRSTRGEGSRCEPATEGLVTATLHVLANTHVRGCPAEEVMGANRFRRNCLEANFNKSIDELIPQRQTFVLRPTLPTYVQNAEI